MLEKDIQLLYPFLFDCKPEHKISGMILPYDKNSPFLIFCFIKKDENDQLLDISSQIYIETQTSGFSPDNLYVIQEKVSKILNTFSIYEIPIYIETEETYLSYFGRVVLLNKKECENDFYGIASLPKFMSQIYVPKIY